MQPEEDTWRPDQSALAGAGSLGGGADSSNRPWETDTLRVGSMAGPSALGLLAVAAAALLSLADMALLYSPNGGYGFGTYEPLADVPRWRLLVGHYLGVLLLPAYIAGYWLAARGLTEAGLWRSRPVFLLGSYAAVLAGSCHGLFALMALMAQHGAADPAGSAALMESARAFIDPLHGLVNVLFALTSLWFAAAVLSARTRFSHWSAAANPLLLAVLFAVPYYLAPGFTPARLAAPASFNLAHLVFFSVITVAMRRTAARR